MDILFERNKKIFNRYFYDVNINLLKRGFGNILKVIFNSAGKKIENKSIYSE